MGNPLRVLEDARLQRGRDLARTISVPRTDSAESIRRLLAETRDGPEQIIAPPLSLMEMDTLAPIPGVEQVPIQRYQTTRPPTELELAFPRRRRALMRDINRGVQQGADQWYYNEPLRQQFIYELGEQAGNADYDLFARMVAGSSSSAPVRENIRKASYYRQMALRGLLPNDIDSLSQAAEWLAANPPPPGYGSLASRNDALWTSHFLNGDQTWRAAEPGAAHKILSFDQNLRGNFAPWTGDRHEGLALGVPMVLNSKGKLVKGQLTPNQYVAAERMMNRFARQIGLPPARIQSARWMGGAERTGVRSPDPSFPHAVETVVRAQAERLGEAPEWVMREFIRNGGLLSLPAAAALSDDGH